MTGALDVKLYFFWDAYCGWCHGFKAILTPFMAQHPDLELDIISGGLFDQGNPISAYPHIPQANAQIEQLYGVTFGDAYQKVLTQGDYVMNSYHVATGFGILRDLLPQSQRLQLASDLQNAWYHDGKSLSDVSTYQDLARHYHLNVASVTDKITTAFESDSGVHPDYLIARQFGVQSYPTLVLELDGHYYDLRGNATTTAELLDNFARLTA